MLVLYVKLQTVLKSLKDEQGQDLIEYALIGALIAVACTAAMGTLATAIVGEFSSISVALSALSAESTRRKYAPFSVPLSAIC